MLPESKLDEIRRFQARNSRNDVSLADSKAKIKPLQIKINSLKDKLASAQKDTSSAQKVLLKKIPELEYIKDELTSKFNELELLKSESVIGIDNKEQRKQSFEFLTHPIMPTIKNIMNSKEQGLKSPIHDIPTISKPRKNLHKFFYKDFLSGCRVMFLLK
ncbi:hypothetical protein G9A89_012515 [Geosiphon pyriformis]|nr:hypothetical protein G9A89_012515 [Geosiphon pyriformis]